MAQDNNPAPQTALIRAMLGVLPVIRTNKAARTVANPAKAQRAFIDSPDRWIELLHGEAWHCLASGPYGRPRPVP